MNFSIRNRYMQVFFLTKYVIFMHYFLIIIPQKNKLISNFNNSINLNISSTYIFLHTKKVLPCDRTYCTSCTLKTEHETASQLPAKIHPKLLRNRIFATNINSFSRFVQFSTKLSFHPNPNPMDKPSTD